MPTLLPFNVSQETVKIIQLSDLHILPEQGDTLLGIDTAHYFKKVLSLALEEHPQADLLLLTGDLAQQPVLASYRKIADALKNIPIPVLCLPGNHDDYALMQKVLTGNNIVCAKQILLHNWHIICLNSKRPGSPGGYLAEAELQRLEYMLKVYPRHPALIAVHHPCCSIDSVWMDEQRIANSEALLALLERHKQVRAITSGHIHQIINRRIGNLQVFSAPSTCFQFRPGSDDFAVDKTAPGYRWFNLYPDGHIESAVSRLPAELSELRSDLQGGY